MKDTKLYAYAMQHYLLSKYSGYVIFMLTESQRNSICHSCTPLMFNLELTTKYRELFGYYGFRKFFYFLPEFIYYTLVDKQIKFFPRKYRQLFFAAFALPGVMPLRMNDSIDARLCRILKECYD